MGNTGKIQWRARVSLPDLAIVLVLLTVVVYLPAIQGGFVFDDASLITGNRIVKAGDGLLRAWRMKTREEYYPLTVMFRWLEWRVWGASPMGYHVVNVLLHASNAILVWIILKRLRIPGAWMAGLVFAVHPLNVASVAWISEQKNTLSMLFSATAILLYLQFYEKNRWSWYGLSLTAFLLALLSKVAVVPLPAVLLGCVWWLRGELRRRDFLYSGPFFACSLVWGMVCIHVIEPAAQIHQPLSRLITAGDVPWFYLFKTFLPINLMVIYPQWEINPSRWMSYVPVTVLIGGFVLFWWKRKTWGRPLLFGLGYYVVTLGPVLGFVDQSFNKVTAVADHWQYYAMVAPIALVIAGGEWMGRRLGERRRYWGAVAGVILLLALGMGTWRRSSVYRDGETLWRDNLAKNPDAWMVRLNLGLALQEEGKLDEAMAEYKQALHIKPDMAEAYNNMGNILRHVGRLDEAMAQYNQALRIKPDSAEVYNNLGSVLRRVGRLDEAIADYEQAIRIDPDYANAHSNLGNAFAQSGKLDEAIAHYRQAIRIETDVAITHFNLGNALGQAGRVKDAIAQYEEALRLDPDFTQAKMNLARLQAAQ